MSHRHTACTRLVVIMVVLASLTLAGCAAKKYVMVEKPKGVTLEYRMPEGEIIRYTSSQQADQTMEMMGMAIENKMSKSYEFSVAPGRRDGDAYRLEITIDSMDAGMVTPQSDFEADVEPVIGKSFGMSLSVLGKELDVSEADPIHYGVGPMGTRSIMPDFKAMFPDLPDIPVSIGDTWTTRDTLNVDEGGIDILILTESVNTLAGFETMTGLECAKVTAEVTGVVSGGGERDGAQVSFEGTLSGTETWYFAHEQGLFVDFSSDVFSKSMINVTGPQEMSFPMSEKMSLHTALVR